MSTATHLPADSRPLGDLPHPASEYVESLFYPDDLISIMTMRTGEKPQHQFVKVRDITAKFWTALQKRNDTGEHVYVCMNPLTDARRIKENVANIRTLYLDIDRDFEAATSKIRQSVLVPKPHFILKSSPGKGYAIWCVKDISPANQEQILRALVQEFNGDPAAAEMVRVLRLPGFINCKYETKPVVEIIESNFDGKDYVESDFHLNPPTTTAPKPPFQSPERIPDGERNDTLHKLASSLRAKGLSDGAVRAAVAAENDAKCDDPLDESELNALLDSALKPEHREADLKWREDHRVSREPQYTKTADPKPSKTELEFHLPAAENPSDYDFVTAPLPGQIEGWLPRGGVSLIGASSGGSKTTLISQLLIAQLSRLPFLGHETFGYSFAVIGVDRGAAAHRRTLRRMHLTPNQIPFMPLPARLLDESAAQAIVNLVEGMSPLPQILFIEGIDMMLSKPSDSKLVTDFMHMLGELARRYHIAILGSGGSPKVKEGQGYLQARDNFFGSEKWGRTAETMIMLQAIKPKGRRRVTIEMRNAPAEEFILEYQDGILVPVADSADPDPEIGKDELEILWFKAQARKAAASAKVPKFWTVEDFTHSQTPPIKIATAYRRIGRAQEHGWIIERTGPRRAKEAKAYCWNESETNPLWGEAQSDADQQEAF